MTKIRTCKDCAATSMSLLRKPRPAPHPGPRCATHHRIKKKADSKRNGELRAEKTYGITPEDYQALLAAQNGKCALCGRRIGVSRRAAIDHDHGCADCGGTGCRACVRGLVDVLCNKDVLGRFGDDPARFDAIAEYLRNPPARRVIALRPA